MVAVNNIFRLNGIFSMHSQIQQNSNTSAEHILLELRRYFIFGNFKKFRVKKTAALHEKVN